MLSSRRVGALAHRPAQLGDVAYSSDGRYLAARVLFSVGRLGVWGIVVARSDGRIVRLIRSKDASSPTRRNAALVLPQQTHAGA